MAAPAGNNAVRVVGQLFHTPTGADLTQAGNRGTPLGLVDRIIFEPRFLTRGLVLEETNRVHQVLYCGQRPRLSFSLESFDADALAILFPTVMAGGLKGPRLKDGDDPVGVAIASKVVLFVPDKSSHPALILYAARPLIEEAAEVRMTAVNPMTFPAAFELGSNANGWVYQQNAIAQLELNPAA